MRPRLLHIVRRVWHPIPAEENKLALPGEGRLLIKPQSADDGPCQAVAFQNAHLRLKFLVEAEASASEARRDVAHIQGIGTLGIDRKVCDRFVATRLERTIQTSEQKHHDH